MPLLAALFSSLIGCGALGGGQPETDHTASLPRTLTGYRAMFAKVSTSEWGGGDIAITTRIRDGRVVWLFGDTLSQRNGFVHSSALVQAGHALHVSAHGRQLLPDGATKEGRTTIYWVEKAAQVDDRHLVVWSTAISVGHDGPWDFRRLGTRSRVARVALSATGDLSFVRWVGYSARPPGAPSIDGSDLHVLGPHHYAFQRIVHRDLPLASGKHLVTESQNWDDPLEAHLTSTGLRYTDWRPLLSVS